MSAITSCVAGKVHFHQPHASDRGRLFYIAALIGLGELDKRRAKVLEIILAVRTFTSILSVGPAPNDPAAAKDEVASAAFAAPHRRLKRREPSFVLMNGPFRARSLEQTELNLVTAAARTKQRRSPDMFTLAGDVEDVRFRFIGQILDALETVQQRQTASAE